LLKSCKIWRMAVTSWRSAFLQMIRSSENISERIGQLGPIMIPERWSSCRACLRQMDSSFIAMSWW
jgi:hypothetical protein